MEVRMKEVDGGGVEKQWNALEPNGTKNGGKMIL